MIDRTNILLAALLAVVVILTLTVGGDPSKRNFEILPDMRYTPAWASFSANPDLPGGRTMQPPPPGAIARGQLPLHYRADKEDAVRAGRELRNPYRLELLPAADQQPPDEAGAELPLAPAAAPTADVAAPSSGEQPATQENATGEEATTEAGAATGEPPAEISEQQRRQTEAQARLEASAARGNEVFRVFCVACHGAQGQGDGPVARRGFPPPPSLLTGKSLQMQDGQLFHILSYGQGSMTPFAGQLSPARRWDAVNYIRELQRKAPPPTGETAAVTQAASPAAPTPARPDEPAEPDEPTPAEPDGKTPARQPPTPPATGDEKGKRAEAGPETRETSERATGSEEPPAPPSAAPPSTPPSRPRNILREPAAKDRPTTPESKSKGEEGGPTGTRS